MRSLRSRRVVLAAADETTAYKLRVDAAGRAKQNDKNNELIRIAVLEDQNDLFTIITESMVETAKLRTLRGCQTLVRHR